MQNVQNFEHKNVMSELNLAVDVVIMAAGKGTRMISKLPKVLHRLAGKSLIFHVLDTAAALSARQVVVVTGHGAEVVESAISRYPLGQAHPLSSAHPLSHAQAKTADPISPNVSFVRQEPQLGTGHAVQQAVPNLPDDGLVVVLSGDVPLTQASTLKALMAASQGADRLIDVSQGHIDGCIYASPANGVTRFRLQVGSVFADFDLSSIAVLSSVGTLYNKIVQADTSTGWYLCTIIGPTQALGTLNFTTDTVIPADLLQKLIPFQAAPDNQSIDDLRYNYVIKGFADTTTMLSNFYIADGSTYTGNKQLLDSFVAGTLEGYRTSGNQAENVKFLTKFVAHRAGEFTSLTIKLINDVRGSAAKVAEDVFVNKTNKTWFQLAPYYSSSVHIDDYPTDYERVRVGSQSGGVRSSNDPFETINLLVSRFFVNKDSVTTTERKLGNFIGKQIDETKLIPTIPKFDAAAVAGLFYNTIRNIDGNRYTPQDGNYVYYKKTDWYSLAPRYARPRFALGTANTPGTVMIDNMQLGDSLTYYQNYHLYDYLLIGSPDGVRGTSDNENFSYNLNMRPRRGAFTDLYIAKLRPTKFDADQTAGIFWGSSNSTTSYTKLNPYGRRWFQLAPYYASYEHIKDTPGQYDFVRVGSVRGGQRHLGWPTEIMSLGMLKTPYETSVTTDVRGNFFNLTALRGDTNAGTGYWTTRTNYISSSGVFTGADWIKSNITLSSNSEQIFYDPVTMGYRSTINDANQVVEMFYSPKNNTAGKRWYDIVPVRPQSLTPLILDKIPILTETTSVGQHYMETVVNKPVTADQYYLFRVIALTRSGTNNIRVYINNDYADFTLYGATAVSVSNTNMTSFTATYGAYGGALGLLGRTTSTSVTVRIQLIDQSGNTSYAGTTANSVWVWGAQLEFGEYFNPTNQILVYNSLKNPGDYYRNSWIKSTNGPTSRPYEIFGTDTRTDGVTIGLDQDARLGGSSRENVSFLNKFVARRSGDATSILITLGSITRTSADQTAEVFDNIKTSTPIMNTWYQLAPYYRSSLYNSPTDYDLVRVGSQTRSRRTSSDPYETLSFWLAPKPLTDSSTATDIKTAQFVRKEFSETRMIPNNPRFDAARVAGIDLVSSGAQRINLKAYTPIAGSTTYYKSWDWFSLAPLSNRAIYALGNAGAGPIMLDNMALGDSLTYDGTKLLSSIALTVGTQLTSVNLSYAPTVALPVISSTTTTAGTEGNLITYSKQLDQWTATSAAVIPDYGPANPDPLAFFTADQISLLTNASAPGGGVRQALSRNISAGVVCNFTVWIKVTNNAFAFKFGLQVSGVDYGIQINNPGAPMALTQNGAGVTPIAVTVTSNGYYRYSFNISTPTNLTPANTNIILSGTGSGFGTQILGVWGWSLREFRSTPVTLGQEVTTTSTAIEYAASSISVTYTYPTSTAAPTNIGTKYSNDPRETTDVRLNKTAKQAAFTDLYVRNRRISPLDADQVHGILFNSSNNTTSIIRNNPYRRAWYQLAPYYNSYGHVKQSPDDLDRVLVSYKELFQPWLIKTNTDTASTTGDGGTRKQTGQNSLETTRLDVQLFARRSALTTSNVLITTKTNWVNYSEDFTGFYWGKTNAAAVQAPQLMSGLYPYRNTNLDAVQVANQFMLISTSSAFTRYNNYYNRAWYAPAPLTNRVAFSSTVLQYLTDQDQVGQHYMQAEVQLRDYSIPEEWVTYSLHVQRQSGARRFRMDVGRCYADFDLSSVSVVTSTQTVRYANIRFVDTSAGVFLCQIIAPIQTFPNTLIRFAVSSDTITAGDSGINFLFRDKRTFNDAVVGTESINNDKITDYHL
jgi:CTP:molybdopterin cytidylyltransferase MocA